MFIGTESYFVLVRTSSSSPFVSFHGFALHFFSFVCTSVCRYERSHRHRCGMIVKCVFVVKCELWHHFSGFSTFIALYAPRRCLPHVASSNEVWACSSQEAIIFRHYRATFAQSVDRFFPQYLGAVRSQEY